MPKARPFPPGFHRHSDPDLEYTPLRYTYTDGEEGGVRGEAFVESPEDGGLIQWVACAWYADDPGIVILTVRGSVTDTPWEVMDDFIAQLKEITS